MGKFDGVLLASDYDNTLVYTKEALERGDAQPHLPERNRKALEYFIANGGSFALATGRALAAIEGLAGEIPMNVPGIICNGAALYDFDKKEYLVMEMLDEAARERGQQLLNAFPAVACEAYHIDNVIHAVQPNEITAQHQVLTRVSVVETESLLQVPLPIGKLLFEGANEELLQAKAFLEEQGWAGEYELIFSSPYLLEVTARGASKGGMIRRLAKQLGVSSEQIYCVGDEANDLTMLTVAAEAFAPANCIPEVAAVSTVVCHAKDGALADVVALLDQRY